MIFKNGFTSARKKFKDRNADSHPKKDEDEENDYEPE
jgi:hypothetical protein